MFQHLRLPLVICLLLLQGLTPFVHAHVYTASTDNRLHIEGINLPRAGQPSLTQQYFAANNLVISICSSIQQTPKLTPRPVSDNNSVYCPPAEKITTHSFIQYLVAFSPHEKPLPAPVFSTTSPRAPPLHA